MPTISDCPSKIAGVLLKNHLPVMVKKTTKHTGAPFLDLLCIFIRIVTIQLPKYQKLELTVGIAVLLS